MEEGWERRTLPLRLDQAELEELLAPVFPGRHLSAFERLTSGLANTNYRVTLEGTAGSDGEVFVVRLYQREPAACAREVELARLVRERVPVPEIVYADIDGARGGTPYSVARWDEGIPLQRVLVTMRHDDRLSLAGSLGATLAAIHSFGFPEAGFFGAGLDIAVPLGPASQGFREYIRSQLDANGGAERLGAHLATRTMALVERNAWRFGESAGPAVLVHGDYKASNLLVRRDPAGWSVAAVLDWEFASANEGIYDMGILLRDERAFPREIAPAFARGYTDAGGTLPPDWYRLAKLSDLVNLTTFLTSARDASVLGRDVKALLAASMTDLEAAGW